MSWAKRHKEALAEGKTIQIRPRGQSMSGLIESGNLVTIEPWDNTKPPLTRGDIVLCRVNGSDYLHKIVALSNDQVQISNNHGYINGWAKHKGIFGLVIKIEK